MTSRQSKSLQYDVEVYFRCHTIKLNQVILTLNIMLHAYSCINFFEIAIHFYYREASKTIYFNFPSQDSGVTFKFLQNLPTSKAVLTKISKNILSSPSACGWAELLRTEIVSQMVLIYKLCRTRNFINLMDLDTLII